MVKEISASDVLFLMECRKVISSFSKDLVLNKEQIGKCQEVVDSALNFMIRRLK